MRCSIAPPFLQPAAVLYRPSSCICRYCHVCLKWAIPYPVRLLSLDILGYDFVQCAVVLQCLKSAVDFLQQLCVSLLYSNGILFIGKGLLQNLQSFCLSNKGLGRLPVDYNRVNLALAQCLNSLKALVVTLYRGSVSFQVRYIDIACGSQLHAYDYTL